MTFQQKLLLGFGLMVLPVLLVGAEAIRSNALERRALETLGESLTRTRTYSEVETAMFDQGEVIWRSLSGMEPARAGGVPAHRRGGGLLARSLEQRAAAR